MTNQEIAAKLREVYNLMQLAGENRFRAIAFDRAAQTIESLNEEITKHIEEDTLTEIKGIGKSIAEDIKAYAATGTMPVLQDLKERVPDGLIEWLNISGLGPKSIVKIHKALGITEIPELKEACQSGAVADLPGLGKKSAERILKSIEYLEKFGERIRLDQALDLAQPFYEFIQETDGVMECQVAGSLRRSRETIGDIDILASAKSEKIEAIFDAFVSHELVQEVLGRGDTKSSVRTLNGRQVDLRIVKPEEFPAALLYFTGSKEHNIVLRQRARERGMALNEYGLFELNVEKKTNFSKPVKIESEADIYNKLDLHFIPPEHREDLGEFEFYQENVVMDLVDESDIKGVIHMHSTWSDGRNTIRQMAEACMDLGYEYMGISDHSRTAAYAGGLTIEEVQEQWKEIEELNREFENKGKNFRIFKGIESDILADGSLDYPEEILAGFEFVIASVHSGLELPMEVMMERFEAAIRNPYTTMIGHPTGRLLLRRDESKLDLNILIELAAEKGVPIEINANPRRLDLDWRYGNKAKETGLLTSINTDAHDIGRIRHMHYGVLIARKAKFDARRVINALSAAEFEEQFTRK